MDIIATLYGNYLNDNHSIDTAVEKRAADLSGATDNMLKTGTLTLADLAEMEEAFRFAGFSSGYKAGFWAAMAAIASDGVTM